MKLKRTIIFIISFMFAMSVRGAVIAHEEQIAADDRVEPTAGVTTTATAGGTSVTMMESGGRPRIAVLTLENPPNYYNSSIGTGLTDILIERLVGSGRFVVTRPAENPDLRLDDIEFGIWGQFDPDTMVEIGRNLDVDYILRGRVTGFGYEETTSAGFLGGTEGIEVTDRQAVVRLELCIIDAADGGIALLVEAEGAESENGVDVSGADWSEWVEAIDFESGDFLESMIGYAALDAIDNLLKLVLPKFPIQAPILAVEQDFVIIDIGAINGIDVGMEFEVYRISMVTSTSGEEVWENRVIIGRVEITEVGQTSSKATIASGSGFLEGDLCIHPERAAEDNND